MSAEAEGEGHRLVCGEGIGGVAAVFAWLDEPWPGRGKVRRFGVGLLLARASAEEGGLFGLAAEACLWCWLAVGELVVWEMGVGVEELVGGEARAAVEGVGPCFGVGGEGGGGDGGEDWESANDVGPAGVGGLLGDGAYRVVGGVDDGMRKPEHLSELGDVHAGDDAGEEHLVDDVE